jgi:GDP-L-fucose synthase
MNKNSKIYISGHAGMVGKTLWQLLKEKGYKNLIGKKSSELDLRDAEETEKFFRTEKPEYVFHLAAKVGGIMDNIEHPADFLHDNLAISLNIINCAYEFGVKKLLNLGSSCVYPRNCKQPMKEEYLLSGGLEPTNEAYALAKISALKLCEYYNKQYGTDFTSLMPCNLYGINEKFDPKYSHVISGLILKFHNAKIKNDKNITLWGTGKARREFLYVEDFVKIALFFMEKFSVKDLNNSFINIGSGKDVSIKELAHVIADIVDYKGEIKWDLTKPDGMPEKLMDVKKMKKFWSPPLISLEKGIKLTYNYYLKTLKK